jgi:septal ring factor EnvC (AmiA/AmiB activator)
MKSQNTKTNKYCCFALRQVQVLLYCAFVMLSVHQVSAQASTQKKKEQLQQQMQKLQDEIKNIEAAIKNTSAKKQKSMSEILSLQAMIQSREKLIGNISNQVGNLDETISETELDIQEKSAGVEEMKKDYAVMLRKAYQNNTLQNELAFLFSASDFFEAVRRYNYLTKISEYRRNQAKVIQQSIAELVEKKEKLETNKEKKLHLLEQQTAQKTKLEDEKKEKDGAIAKLQEKEKRLRKQIDEKNKAAAQLNSRIQAIIEDEIRQARKKAEAANKNNTTAATKKNDEMPLTPEEQLVSKNFSNNIGKLPWPVTKGHIVSQFGKHEHPVIKGVMIENNGVDIKTEPGAEARAVFGGKVVSIFFLPTTQNCVIVKHGDYFTVYSNIENVAVKANDDISVKQSLGKLHTDKNDELTKVHLEIWRGKEKMNPQVWLAN